ncbi:nucleotidyl transferase AbiEii/AbiGii toxin family protein [Prevotella sp. P2-180]|uniref:nucleotidyl transferase AbiEii/AbiGii toxin family protein n=1 Tax=Prevotella sp. P2-180 TaxID=2024224 RepID=UPI000B96AF62|nr:nucleotidyl transferase AbiEii/AbiGii toxin family protein [Prevotella sp. P2-180]OYP69202.1 nucleotidyltransferase [Prevotella sp. P2-180]
MKDRYRKQVALLIRIMPSVYKIKEFAVHGGTAINLFHRNLLRYSVDIDVTYIPIEDRQQSLASINQKLLEVKKNIEKTIPGVVVKHKPDVWKLLCTMGDATVKIEVNATKRGIIGDVVELPLCEKARNEFSMGCKARTVSFSQLYGGKITAALSRQHPRDLFDCKYMELQSFDDVKNGFMLCLLGSDKPIIESLQPHDIDQTEALENQFQGMTETPFGYEDYLESRTALLGLVNGGLTITDKEFLLSFEQGEPDWNKCCAGDLSQYPSVQWKLLNIGKLKESNPVKFEQGVNKLRRYLLDSTNGKTND